MFFYITFYPKEITYTSSTDSYDGNGWYFELGPIFSETNSIEGENNGNVYPRFYTNVKFPITNENEGEIISTEVYRDKKFTISKNGTEYEISYAAKDDEGSSLVMRFKGSLLQK
ncbi:hypothetical protein [Carboxylicivirga caseinilyticus]|uniref:hypothetical protein n=1 Tax=Carboxylicivirga caseinilyticus TaxID=3417572 RepID=UPI003D34CE76|nr:hypothetical protein [Marinilabiliaceae bacterium A049]